MVARNPQHEIVGASAGVQWQTGAYVVSSVVVAESARRQGIGSLVTLSTAQEFFARGAQSVNLGVRTTNRGALAMYKAIGFDEQFDLTRANLRPKD
jgi:ribosomal protein S18 acetylase RimI-like enzyme